jgi:hypothetical protein
MSNYINLDGNLILLANVAMITKPRFCKYEEEWTIRIEGTQDRGNVITTKDQAEALEWHQKLVTKVLEDETKRSRREAN